MLKVLKSVLLWYAYYPHLGLLRLIGPRAASLVAWLLSTCQWLVAMIGPPRGIRRAMAAVLPDIRPDLSVSRTLRRYYLLKQQTFVDWNLYPTSRGQRFVAKLYRNAEGCEHLDAALARGKGAIILAMHFGTFRMVMPALQELGYDNSYHLVLRGEKKELRGDMWTPIARAIMRRRMQIENGMRQKLIYYREGSVFGKMAKVLRGNGVLGIGADGMNGSQFVNVPFLGSEIPLSTGPAWLAVRTGAAIIPSYCVMDGLYKRRVIFHEPIYAESRKRDAIEPLVRAGGAILDRHVRETPWAWWYWRRIEITRDAEGHRQIVMRELSEKTLAVLGLAAGEEITPTIQTARAEEEHAAPALQAASVEGRDSVG